MSVATTTRLQRDQKRVLETSDRLVHSVGGYQAAFSDLAQHRNLSTGVAWQVAYGLPEDTLSDSPEAKAGEHQFHAEREALRRVYDQSLNDVLVALHECCGLAGDRGNQPRFKPLVNE